MTAVVKILNSSEIEQAKKEAAAIARAGKPSLSSATAIYFVAFDGTDNDRDHLSRGMQCSNVAQLEYQVSAKAADSHGRLASRYYPGVSGFAGVFPTLEAARIAEKAYVDFCHQVRLWGATPAGAGDLHIGLALTSFSRGFASAAAFSQLVFEYGVPGDNGSGPLVAPGALAVSAAVIFDPVLTGVGSASGGADGNYILAPGATNVVMPWAKNEYRYSFELADLPHFVPAVAEFGVTGCHTDIGGGYDNGLGALTLEAATGFFVASGLPIAPVPQARQFNGQRVVIHSAALNDAYPNPDGSPQRIWSEYASVDAPQPRLRRREFFTAPNATGANSFSFTDYASGQVEYRTRSQQGQTVVTEVKVTKKEKPLFPWGNS